MQLKNKQVTPKTEKRNIPLKTPAFSRYTIGLLLIVLISISILLLFFNMTYPNLNEGTPLSIFIHLLGVYGICMVFRTIKKIEKEKAIVDIVEERGGNYLGEIKSKQSERVDINKLEEKVLPYCSEKNPPAMIRLFQHICKEAKDRKFESSIAVIQPYREESIGDMFNVQKIQNLALHLGIMGTFVGLIKALFSLSHHGFANFNFSNLSNLFSSLHISFSTSIAGLEVSIFLGAMLMLLRKSQQVYFQKMESAVVTMLSLARNAENKDDFLVEFHQVRHSIKQLNEKVEHQTHAMEVQTNTITSGLTKLVETKSEFDGFTQQLKESQEKFIGDLNDVYDMISIKNIGPRLEKIMETTVQNVATKLNTNLEAFSREMIEFNKKNLSQIRESQKLFIDDMREIYDISSLKNLSEQYEKKMMEIIQRASENFNQNMLLVSEKLKEFNLSPSKLNDTLDRLETHFQEQMELLQKEISQLYEVSKESAKVHEQTAQIQGDFKNNMHQILENAGLLNKTIFNLNKTLSSKSWLKKISDFMLRPIAFLWNKIQWVGNRK
jgi:hypothetical protein